MTTSSGQSPENSPRFLPYRGASYGEPRTDRPSRILVLGESHYAPPGAAWADDPRFTQDVVERWALARRDRFFTVVAKLLLDLPAGVHLSDDARRGVWSSVAFYNYVQQAVAGGPRDRPTAEAWRAARAPFRVVLAELRPDVVLVLGKTLWYQIEGFEPVEGAPDLRWLRVAEDRRALATMVNHPSSPGFQLDRWRAPVQGLFAAAARLPSP